MNIHERNRQTTGEYTLPSQRFGDLNESIPGLENSLRVLDEITLQRNLTVTDQDSLVIYSLWLDNSHDKNALAETLRTTDNAIWSGVSHVIDDLEDIWDEFEKKSKRSIPSQQLSKKNNMTIPSQKFDFQGYHIRFPDLVVPQKSFAHLENLAKLRQRAAIDLNTARTLFAFAHYLTNPVLLQHASSVIGESVEALEQYTAEVYSQPELLLLARDMFNPPSTETMKPPPHETVVFLRDPQVQLGSLHDDLQQVYPYLLNDKNREIVEAYGQSNSVSHDTVVESVDLSQRTVRLYLTHIRALVEPVLERNGIKRVGRYKDDAVEKAASYGNLSSERYLDLYYTDDQSVKEYYKKSRRKNFHATSLGFITLREAVSNTEYQHILTNQRLKEKYIRKIQGMYYIKKDVLEEYREERRQMGLDES